MDRKITFIESQSSALPNHRAEGSGQDPDANPKEELHKARPEADYHPGQDLSTERQQQNQVGTLRHGFERLNHMYSLGIPLKFEELQGRQPIDFVEETKEHFRLHPDPVKKPAQPEDTTLFDIREWLEPLTRKGQLYWDYCRDKWLEKDSKLGSACAPISCIYSLWSVTDHCMHYGGFVFMAVYLLITVGFIIPFIYMELTLGQFHRQGLVKAIKQTCPLFQGLAYLMLASSLFDYLLSMTRISWLAYYLQFTAYLHYPWRHCDQPIHTSKCVETLDHHAVNVTYNKDERTPALEWFRFHVSRPWNHWEIVNAKPTVAQVIAGLFPNPRIIFWFLVLLFIFRLVMKLCCRQLGCIMLGVFYVGFITFGFSLISFNHTFPTDIQRSVYEWFFKMDHLKYFFDKNTWATAIRHAVISSGVGTGIYITFGSHSTFPKDDLKGMSILSGLASFFLHCNVAVFFILCLFTIRTTDAFKNATTENYGNDYMFEIFPQVFAQHHQPGLGNTTFFSAANGLLIFSSLRVLCALRTLRQFFVDRDKEYYEPCRVNYNYWEHDKMKRQQRYINLHLSPQRSEQLMTKIMFWAGLVHLIFFLPGGAILLSAAEEYWYNYISMFIIMVECLAIFFFAGVRTLDEYVRKMTSWQVTLWYRFTWKVFVPIIPILYLTHPPRIVSSVGGIHLPYGLDLIWYASAGLPFFFLYISILHTWRRSRAKTCCKKFLLEVTPQHEHAGMIAGRKPSTRLHWMHHLHVPAGISRGFCLPSYDGPLLKPDPARFDTENKLMNILWYGLKFRWFNGLRDGCVNYPAEQDYATSFHMFPPIPFPMKPPKKDIPFPEYLPNQAIRRVHKLKKYKDFKKQRKAWVTEKVELERERMAVDHEERDIEMGIMGGAAKQAHEEDEEVEFFDMFDSTEEEVWEETSTDSSEDSFDVSSDNGRGKESSPSVSTSDSFDSQESVFRWSGEEDTGYSRPKSVFDSDSSSEDDDDKDDDADDDEVDAPAMDYGEDEGVPYDDDTDSWDLEVLEDLDEDFGPGGIDPFEQKTSEDETDTDDIVEPVSEESPPSEVEEESDDDEEDEEDESQVVDEAKPEDKKTKKKKLSVVSVTSKKSMDQSEEANSWSLSCGSDSTCSSLNDDDESSDDSDDEEEEDDKDMKRGSSGASYKSDEDELPARKNDQNSKLRLFRTMAETLDTFLHISKKKEKERMAIIQEQVDKAMRDEKKAKDKKGSNDIV